MAINIPVTSKPRVVIIGAGFAGLQMVKSLAGKDVQIVLIDQNNYHTFQPLLYQVATAGLEPNSIAYPVREIFRQQKNFIFRMAEVLEIRPDNNCVVTSIGEISFDHLIIATGSKTNFFGMKDIQERAISMKSVPDAMELRNIVLEDFEKALLTTSLEERDRLMTFVIIGGGPTGVELAGAFGELKRVVLPHDHPELDFEKMQIHLVDMADRLLSSMSPQASSSVEKFMKDHDINLWLGAKVTSYDGNKVLLSNGRQIQTCNVIWAAGVKGAVIPGLNTQSILGGRILTDEYSRVSGHKNIYALGDVAAVITEKSPKGYPMLAPVAVQQAKLLAENLLRLLKGDTRLKPFVYQDLGVMATVGKHHAVADVFFGKFQGLIAWWLWAVLHLFSLIGFRNKMVAIIDWVWGYFRYDRGLRLIIRSNRRCGKVL